MERSPSPEPFKEPDGMVTIDLNRQSPTLLTIKRSKANTKKTKRNKVVTYIIVIFFFCLMSFFTTLFIHLDDIQWFFSKLGVKNKEEIINGTPELLKSELKDETYVEQQTCPLDFRDQYKIQLSVCEKSQTFSDCCHVYLRSNLPEINEACSVIELLNLLTEFRELFPRRRKRHYTTEYTESDYNAEQIKKQKSKIETEKKVKSYLETVNEPLRKELPALWNWIGNLFFQKDDIKSLQPKHKTSSENKSEDYLYLEERPDEKKLEILNGSEGSFAEISTDKETTSGSYKFEESQINEQSTLYTHKFVNTDGPVNAETYDSLSVYDKNENKYLPLRSDASIENVDNNTENYERINNFFDAEEMKEKDSESNSPSLHTQHFLNFHKEYNKSVLSFPKYSPATNEKENALSGNSGEFISDNGKDILVTNKTNRIISETRDKVQTNDSPVSQYGHFHSTHKGNENSVIIPTHGKPFESLKNSNDQVDVSVKSRKKRYQINDIYTENIPMEDQVHTIPEYSRYEDEYAEYNSDNIDANDYRNPYNQIDESVISPNMYYKEGPPQNLAQYNEDEGRAENSLLKLQEEGSNISDERYHSLSNGETESRSQFQTDERNIERQTWKEFSSFHLTQSSLMKQNETQFLSNNKEKNESTVTENFNRKSISTPTTETSVNSSPKIIFTNELGDYDLKHDIRKHPSNHEFKQNNHMVDISNESSRPTVPGSNQNFLQVPTESNNITTETPIVKNTIPADPFDAIDTIQSINQIHANDKSVTVDFENATILLSEKKNKPHISTTQKGLETSTVKNETSFRLTENEEFPHSEDLQRGSSNLDFRGSQQQTDFVPKIKGSSFSSTNEDVQGSQNNILNTCVYPYPSSFGSPYRYAVAYDNPQVLNLLPSSNVQKASTVYVINPSVVSYVPPSPVIPHYGSINQHFNPYGFVNPMASMANPNNIVHGAVQVAGANGQYYLCNPIPMPVSGNVVANLPGVEIRRVSNLQKSSNDMTSRNFFRNTTRAATLNCPMDEQSCLDGTKCISERKVCDNEVHCEDGSDEMFCSCRDRIGEIRLCDGYYDCPDGEDERGCFGCADDEISCDDWSRFRKGTCVLMEQRCDGIRNCDVTGRDEDDCSILTDQMGESNPIKVSNAVGFLHRNFKGKWYPTCFGSELWAMDVCKTEAGPSNNVPKSHLVLTSEKYEGEFINILPNQGMDLVNACVEGRGAFVECPPLFCGLRMTVKNPYRPQEVDTSIEELMNNINRDNMLDESLESARNPEDRSNKNFQHNRDSLLGNERVVGGKASQPAAWPWVVSIYKNGIFHCGGVIINELWIVTAAHCVDKYWQYYYEVQAGILRRFSFSPMEQSRWVVVAIAHEEYNKSNLKNDIALLKLSSPVRYNRYVRPICLPSEATAGQDFLRGPSPGTICTTVGWGAIVEHGTDPDHMREVQVPILKSCKHREDEEGNEICAGLFEGGKDACQGDSGGPFMCQNPNNPTQWYLAGIVSHGEGCARPNEPGVYTRVSQYIGWIADNIREGNFFPRTPLDKCPGYVCKEMNKCIPKKRRCDKIVDCLGGDDELNCEDSFHNIFKHSNNYIPFIRFTEEKDKSMVPLEKNLDDKILSAAIINAEDQWEVTTEVFKPISLVDIDQPRIKTSVIYKYERREYFNNNTGDPDVFRCNRMLQIIPLVRRCNKIIDCEDATDEKDCRCVDYLKLEYPDGICDGIADCIDQSDESICSSCKEEEFNCKMSHMCVSLHLRCNGKPDCREGEDELDCIALTNGKTLSLDTDLRPNLQMTGIVSVNSFGIWRPYCSPVNNNSKSDAEIAAGVCNYLGYEEYTGFKKLNLYNQSLVIESQNSINVHEGENFNSTKCQGLYLWCKNITLNKNILNLPSKNIERDFHGPYTAPWNAIIYAGGIYKCMGALLNDQWVIASGKCLDNVHMYTFLHLSVSLGKGLRNLNIASPYEKILRVVKSVEVNGTDIILLKLEHTIDFNRYIQPTQLSQSAIIPNKRYEECMALGIADEEIKIVFLRSNNTCSREDKCFDSVHEPNCSNDTWSGVITCNSGNGWYPASVFQTNDGACGFIMPTKFTSIKSWARSVEELTKGNDSTVLSATCNGNGYLCKLGNCIEKNKVCDGIPHCRMAEDEDPILCQNHDDFCHLNNTCVCPHDHLTCANGLCIPKEKFCDRNNDCGDFSDEPNTCTCRSYLLVAHSEKVCNGEIDCFDRSDEDPEICPCKLLDFKCKRSVLCIGNEMVCDGVKDCPDGEDESSCYVLAANDSSPNVGEVMTKTAGQISSSCFLKTLSQLSLDEICEKLGFTSCIGHHLEEYNQDSNGTLIPILNNFDVVWIRRDRKIPLMYRMRTGNYAHLGFRKQTNCHRLHVECI